jgi:hypothetical protein
MRVLPSLCEFYLGVCLTTEKKARKNLSQVKKNISQSTKNLSQSTIYTYILPKHPDITKPTYTYTHTPTPPHTHTHTHTLQNNIKPTQYKLKQTQYKIYPNEIVKI